MLRREVIKMGGSLFGLGAGTPSRFPYPDRPQPSPGLGPSAGANVRARVVVVFGPTGTVSGVFVYAPGTTPGPGNTPIAAMSASATDPYGNSIRPGDASALGTIIAIGAAPSGGTPSYVQLVPGNPAQMLISSGDVAEVTAAHIDSLISGGGASRNLNLRLTSPKVSGFSGALSQVLLASAAADGSSAPLCLITATDGVNGSTFEVTPTGTNVIVGPFTATAGTAANPTLITTDGWNSLGTLAGYTVTAGRYRLTTWGAYELDINVTSLGANAANTTFSVALPAGYSGGSSTAYPLTANYTLTAGASYPRLIVTSAGAVIVAQTASKSGLITGQAFVPAT